jgi:hypothetical protein
MTGNAAFDVSSARPAGLGRTQGGQGVSDSETVISGGDAQTDAGVEATSGEIAVGQYLGVTVIRSRPLAKKRGEPRSHPGYEVSMLVVAVCVVVSQQSHAVGSRNWLTICNSLVVRILCSASYTYCGRLRTSQVLIRILPLEDCILPEADKRRIGELLLAVHCTRLWM